MFCVWKESWGIHLSTSDHYPEMEKGWEVYRKWKESKEFPVRKLFFKSAHLYIREVTTFWCIFFSVTSGMVTTYFSKQPGREINMHVWGNMIVFELLSQSSQLQVELLFRKLDMKLLQQVKSDLLFRPKSSLLKIKLGTDKKYPSCWGCSESVTQYLVHRCQLTREVTL